MIIRVMYHSSTGNTKKIAVAIANALNIKAEPIDGDQISISEPIDLLFIGDGIYFGKMNKQTLSFINQLNPAIIKNVAVFATYGGQSSIGSEIQQSLKNKGLKVIGEPFTCKGQAWLFLNRKHPIESDFKNAGEFAKHIVEKIANQE